MNLKKLAITLPAPIMIVGCISLFITFINHGLSDDFFSQWLRVLIISLVIILPTAGLLIMKLSVWVQRAFPKLNPLYQKLILCALIAISLEAIMSLISTISMAHAHNATQFISFWFITLLKSLPLGYVLGMMMVFIVKPKIQRALASA